MTLSVAMPKVIERWRGQRNPAKYRRPPVVTQLPRTQDVILVIGAQDNCLLLRDHSVVGAVGLRSIDISLMTAEDTLSRLNVYSEFLASTRFEFQLLIGTRPQDMAPYYDRLVHSMEQHEQQIARALTLSDRFPDYVATGQSLIHDAGFEQFFGFGPNNFIGMPGNVHKTALNLCDWREVRLFYRVTAEQRERLIARLRVDIETTVTALMHWQDVLAEQLETVQLNVLRAQAPVRTFYVVVSHNPRIRSKVIPAGPMTEKEFAQARQKVDEMCRLTQVFFRNMGLESWRATHQEMLDDIRHFFNPSATMLQARAETLGNKVDSLTMPDFEMRRALHATA